MKKVVCVGSGPKGVDYVNNIPNLDNIDVVGVNNVWKGTDRWTSLIYAGDYYDKDKIVVKDPKKQKLYTRSSFQKSYIWGANNMHWEKARIYCGLPIYFTTMYWTLYYLQPKLIGCIGFDMDYTPQSDGSTSFYGLGYDMQTRGEPDPLYQFRHHYKDLKDPMGTLLERLQNKANQVGCKIVNLSDNPKTQLKWEYNSWEQFYDSK